MAGLSTLQARATAALRVQTSSPLALSCEHASWRVNGVCGQSLWKLRRLWRENGRFAQPQNWQQRQHQQRWQRAAGSRAELDISIDVEPPPIDGDLPEAMEEYGVELSEKGVPLSFNNDDEALEAAMKSVVVFDMSHFGRLRVSGDDRIRFLQNLTTADFSSLSQGQGCRTVFVTPTARTLDISTAWVMRSSVIMSVSPNQSQKLLQIMDRYIFPADKVHVSDISHKTSRLAIIGPDSHKVMEKLGLGNLVGLPVGYHSHFLVEGSHAAVGVGSGLAEKGFTIMLSTDVSGLVWSHLTSHLGIIPMGTQAWERLRVLQGRPAVGAELTDEFNPLEAGLYACLSTTKGCYMGQETIARLMTYDGVKQHLWGLRLPAPVPPAIPILSPSGTKIGKITSCALAPPLATSPAGAYAALGYIKRREAGPGDVVMVDGQQALVVEVPFLKRSLPQQVPAQ